MISGRQTLGSIEAALREQHAKIKQAENKLAALGDQRLEIEKTAGRELPGTGAPTCRLYRLGLGIIRF